VATSRDTAEPSVPAWVPPHARAAVERLLLGNARFVKGEARASRGWTAGLERGQAPFAVILSCADSRTPAELVFDQGLGDLFVVRVAGNVIAPSLAGSVEFAVHAFGVGVVVVMGHTHCGAVQATLDRLMGGHSPGGNVTDIVERISPALRTVLETGVATGKQATDTELMELAVRANVRSSVSHLVHASRHLEQVVNAESLAIVGAVLNLETGMVALIE
jgi:carbonic anhydrase